MEFCAASPTSAAKCVLESGLEDTLSTSAETNDFLHDSVDLSQSSGQEDQDSDAKLEEEFENDFKRKRPKVTKKGKLPATKKTKALPSQYADLVEYLERSQEKDHKFFEHLGKKEAERQLKS